MRETDQDAISRWENDGGASFPEEEN